MTDLPNGWAIRTLGEVATWGSGGTPQAGNPRYYGGQIPWAIIGDLTDSDVFATQKHITEEGLASSSAKLVPKGAILIAMYGSIGKMGIAKVPMATNQAIAFAVPNPEMMDARYLFWYLRSQRDVFLASGKGATQQNISQTLLKSWEIPVPPLQDQKRIVEALDNHLSRLEKALADLDHASSQSHVFRRSILHELLTTQVSDSEPGAKRMSELPEGWVQEPLVKHIMSKSGDSKIIKGKQSPKPQAGLFQGFSASGADVWVPEAHYQGKGIVVSAVGARCGKTFQAEGQWTAIANTHVLVPSIDCGVDFKWLWYLTNDEDFWIRSGTAQPFVKVKDTLLRPQLIPPLDVQKRIVETLDDHLARLDSTRTSIASQRGSIQTLRRSLLNKAFNGELGTD
jgi:type I restriction enzyme S subunit